VALSLKDVRVGAIAYLDHIALRAHPEVDDGGSNINRDGPFLCVQVAGGRACWIPLTTQFRQERLAIKAEWRKDGSPKFKASDLYVNDGLYTFLGPIEAFVQAGANETPFMAFRRPSVAPAGVTAVLAEITAQGGPLLEQ
jgi:hypothetical protein